MRSEMSTGAIMRAPIKNKPMLTSAELSISRAGNRRACFQIYGNRTQMSALVRFAINKGSADASSFITRDVQRKTRVFRAEFLGGEDL